MEGHHVLKKENFRVESYGIGTKVSRCNSVSSISTLSDKTWYNFTYIEIL